MQITDVHFGPRSKSNFSFMQSFGRSGELAVLDSFSVRWGDLSVGAASTRWCLLITQRGKELSWQSSRWLVACCLAEMGSSDTELKVSFPP